MTLLDEYMDKIKDDEPDGFLLRRQVEFIILQHIVRSSVLEDVLLRSSKLSEDHTTAGGFYRLLKDDLILSCEQLRAVEASALRVIYFARDGYPHAVYREEMFWVLLKGLKYGDITPRMRTYLSEYETMKRRRKAYRKRTLAEHVPFDVYRMPKDLQGWYPYGNIEIVR